MRTANALIAAIFAVALIVACLPGPAYAQVVTTTTSSFVNRFGNTVTTTDTFNDGVLVFRDVSEVRSTGVVTLEKHWDFYADGTVQSYTEQRLDGFAPYTIERQYDQNGVVRSYSAEQYMNGELSIVTLQTFDAQGYLLTNEQRTLTTLADGTKVWNVTYETWSADVLVSSQVAQFPYDHDFSAGDGSGDDSAGDGSGDDSAGDGSGDDGAGDDSAAHRPGWGYGDTYHEHDGPPGHELSKDKVSGSADGSVDQRPGNGWGDSKHEHVGKDKDNGKDKDKDKD